MPRKCPKHLYKCKDLPSDEYFVVAGVLTGTESGQKSEVEKIIVHEEFEINRHGKQYLYNDIAIFKWSYYDILVSLFCAFNFSVA